MQASMSPSSLHILSPSQVSRVAECENLIPPLSAFLGTIGGGARTAGGGVLLVSFLWPFSFSTLGSKACCGCGAGEIVVLLLEEGGFSFFLFSSPTATGFGSDLFSLGGRES